MANSFVRPHLKLRMYLHNKNPNTALDTNFLDSYLKDVFGSFILFFLAIGPTVYQVHFKKAKPILKDKDQVPIMQDDKYTSILRKIKAKQQGERISELDDSVKETITFQEYEKLIDELEKQGKLSEMEKHNPRSVFYETTK
eukprot:403338594